MRMKVFLMWLTFLLVTTLAYADTPIIGFISQDATWTKANSPYVAAGNVIVKEGVVLTIEPGATVKFAPKHSLTVNGLLIARGTAEETINFIPKESAKPSPWKGIVFESSNMPGKIDEAGNYIEGSILQYCVIEGAEMAVYGKCVSPYIDHCTIRGNGSGIHISYGKIDIRAKFTDIRAKFRGDVSLDGAIGEALLRELKSKGLWLSKDAIVSVEEGGREWRITDNGKECVVRYEKISNSSWWAFYPHAEDVVICDSHVEGCAEKCIAVRVENVRRLFFIGNTVRANEGGVVSLQSVTATLKDNHIVENKGVALTCRGDSVTINGNEVSDNMGGISAGGNNITISNNTVSRNKKISYQHSLRGAGLHVGGVQRIVIRDNEICDNEVYGGHESKGAGIYIGVSRGIGNIVVRGNRIVSNIVKFRPTNRKEGGGGGLYIRGGKDVVIQDNTFSRNVSGFIGGGVVLENYAIVRDNTFTENIAQNGGGIYSPNPLVLYNNSFIGNKASDKGGGAYAIGTISTNTFIGNRAKYGGGAAVERGMMVAYNVFKENSGQGAAFSYRSRGSAPDYSWQSVVDNLVTNNTGNSAVYIHGNPCFTRNVIVDNSTTYDLEYGVPKISSDGLTDLNATGNYWGDVTEAEIRLRVYDFFQDNKIAVANIAPVLTVRPPMMGPRLEYSATPDHVSGDSIKFGEYAVWPIAVFNWGNGPLTIENIAVQNGTPGFEIISSPFPHKISAGERWGFTVRFLNSSTSADNTYFGGGVCITSDDPYRPEVLKRMSGLCGPKGN